MDKEIKLHVCEKIEAWLEKYEGKEKSVIDLYSDYFVGTPPDDNFNICGNTVKVWRDDFFGVLSIEIANKISSDFEDAIAYVSKHFSKSTPYTYVNIDEEKKVITYYAIISVNNKEYTRELFRKARENILDSLEYSEPNDDYETIYIEDPYTGKIYETAKLKDDTEDFEEDKYDEC